MTLKMVTTCTVHWDLAWLGWAYFSINCKGPGTKGLASICLWFLVLNLHKKAQGIAELPRAVLIPARSYWYTQKTFLGPPQRGFGDINPHTKTKSKTPKLNLFRLTIQEPIFLCPMQNPKAVTKDISGLPVDRQMGFGPPSYFTGISISTPIVSALKN
jgi:hypothetical protein